LIRRLFPLFPPAVVPVIGGYRVQGKRIKWRRAAYARRHSFSSPLLFLFSREVAALITAGGRKQRTVVSELGPSFLFPLSFQVRFPLFLVTPKHFFSDEIQAFRDDVRSHYPAFSSFSSFPFFLSLITRTALETVDQRTAGLFFFFFSPSFHFFPRTRI